MKRILIMALLAAGGLGARAQDVLPREEALKVAFMLCANMKDLLQTPIPTDPDVKRAVGVHEGDYGGLVLPESKLSAETFAKAGKEATPVGQIWFHKLAPAKDGQALPDEQVRLVQVKHDDKEDEAACFALGVRKDANGGLELLLFGKTPQPVLVVPLKAISATQENPIEIVGEHKDDGGLVTLKFVGKYQAIFPVAGKD